VPVRHHRVHCLIRREWKCISIRARCSLFGTAFHGRDVSEYQDGNQNRTTYDSGVGQIKIRPIWKSDPIGHSTTEEKSVIQISQNPTHHQPDGYRPAIGDQPSRPRDEKCEYRARNGREYNRMTVAEVEGGALIEGKL